MFEEICAGNTLDTTNQYHSSVNEPFQNSTARLAFNAFGNFVDQSGEETTLLNIICLGAIMTVTIDYFKEIGLEFPRSQRGEARERNQETHSVH